MTLTSQVCVLEAVHVEKDDFKEEKSVKKIRFGETKEGVDCDRPKSCIISQRNLVAMSGTSPKISSYTKNHMTFEDYVATPLPIFHFVFWLFVVASSVFMASLWTSYGRRER
ncbi:Oidioi.mRNA.OKI2018_I69.XSR.g15377.t1.cds [Oikopleura dioica]|uniref:Oidioi.mRNA.OKI2018_I69.XSR.g15377.t1.cds n=1 Tax=Oikopleura dioica TaxID=34765 RepID=A0ABN7SCP1_OIKDI|nr:Oidioi.mRNA.OKI2018_I69.XSR.g15377.t1.cds [Oikopleura dioica]